MSEKPIDQPARERFAREWGQNFAVAANAGSGKTTAISQRLASLALAPEATTLLGRTAVVTYTNKAAKQIGQKARAVLGKALAARPEEGLHALDGLERAYFGTIHSFCLQLAQRYGHRLGVHLNPTVLAEDDEDAWMEFLTEDALEFRSLPEGHWRLFVRLARLDSVFPLAQSLDRARAERLRDRLPKALPLPLPGAPLELLRTGTPKRKGAGMETWRRNQERVERWLRSLESDEGYVGIPKPEGSGNGVKELYAELFAPVKQWIADVSGVLAAELAERYRIFRLERGWQTYSDQIELAMKALKDRDILDRIRADGWRIILDEAQDTDPQQFAVLVEITRPVGAVPGLWPGGGGPPPRAGHFCMVGDGQQSIYSSRADIRNFQKHLDAFRRGEGGECLEFSVTFRAPARLIEFLNAGLPSAFGPERLHNLGLPPAPEAPAPWLQVPYQPLAERPAVVEGRVSRLPLVLPAQAPEKVGEWMEVEAEQLADFFLRAGPAGVGAKEWGEVCVLAPRNAWLVTVHEVFRKRGLKVALQQRRNRSAENPVYAWFSGLLAVVCDPAHAFEWFGVLREVFGVPDDEIALALRDKKPLPWEDPEGQTPAIAVALSALRPLILQVDDEGLNLASFAESLVKQTRLRERAQALDSSGGLELELDRILAEAQDLGLEGGGPREWLDALLDAADEGRPAGRPEADAINLLTVHSAKGLEWPAVVPVGLWRGIGSGPERGLEWLEDPVAGLRVYYSSSEVPTEMKEARQREAWREHVRLMYVAFTRPQSHLVLPWVAGFGKAPKANEASFGFLWGETEAWDRLPELTANSETEELGTIDDPSAEGSVPLDMSFPPDSAKGACPVLPARVLPHQLAHAPDAARHHLEVGPEQFGPRGAQADEAIGYGLWWHETLEFWPWGAEPSAVAGYLDRAVARAQAAGWGPRGTEELNRFVTGVPRTELEDRRWQRQAELGLLAPLATGVWIDGVIDLILHDPDRKEVWVVDWKTNRRRAEEPEPLFAERLRQEYTPQLQAYREGLRGVFPEARFTLRLYATAAGSWVEIPGEPSSP